MKRLIGFSVILAIALSLMPATQAQAAVLPPDSAYHSLFFNMRGGSLQPGAVLQIYRCTSTATSPNYAQLFYWAYVTHR